MRPDGERKVLSKHIVFMVRALVENWALFVVLAMCGACLLSAIGILLYILLGSF